jgi:pimeloyl-ACP methyl ester carboxylesterase
MKALLAPLITLLLFASPHTHAQDLPRRSFLGLHLEPLTDDIRNLKGIEGKAGVLVNDIVPNSTAAAAGFKKGDVLLRLNDQQISDPAAAVSYVGEQRSTSTFTYELIRNKKTLTGKAVFKSYPTETYPDLDVVYTAAKSEAGLHRIILTKPRAAKAKLPLVVFIGGIGCYSLDAPMDTSRSELLLLNSLARSGFITARLEKPGIGDGAGHSKKCSEISFEEETGAYVAAIRKLKERSDVDPASVYVIGHSMGGVFAPMVAQQTAISGIIAYGTIGSNFPEYLVKTRRTIGEANNWPPEQTDDYVKSSCECANWYFADKLTTEQASAKKAICKDFLPVFDMRSRSYNDQLYAANIPALWKDYTGRVLLLWGESDFVASRQDHEILAAAINFYHKGHASFVPVKNADHGMQLASSFQAALAGPGPYNKEVGNIIRSWLRTQS